LNHDGQFELRDERQETKIKYKCPELPVLDSYVSSPGPEFWKKFPTRSLPEKLEPIVNVVALQSLVNNFSHLLTSSQKQRAKTVIENLTFGAPSYQKTVLPSCKVANAKITEKYGREITDTIGFWIKEGFVCGPFPSPPLDKFRVNSILAIPQEGKVRPVLNVSLPENYSFNDNIDTYRLEKVHMSSAREFGYLLKKCGKGAMMSKFDIQNAYKNFLAKLCDLWLQGFAWMGMYFIDLSQIFGACSAVCNFDQGGHTFADLSIVVSQIPPELVLRHLDDVPVAAPAKTDHCQRFSETYKKICNDIGLKLAPDCPKNEKAFTNVHHGKVLGVWFDANDLTWKLPVEKQQEALELVKLALEKQYLTVSVVEKLIGKLNNACLLCPFMSIFKRNLSNCLGIALSYESDFVKVSHETKMDMKVWAGFLLDMEHGLPIPSEPSAPTIYFKEFASDAAGLSDIANDSAVASIGFDEEGRLFFATRHFWNMEMLEQIRTGADDVMGNNTVFLEFVGILLPFLLIPEKLMHQHLVCKVDNIACVYGWSKRNVKNDVYTSILIRALWLISSFLSSYVHVMHLPRIASWEASVVDRLSRKSTSTGQDLRMLNSLSTEKIPDVFVRWLDHPVPDWNLPQLLLNHVMSRCA